MLNDLLERAAKYAEKYNFDDRQDIRVDVMNAFFAGAACGDVAGREACAQWLDDEADRQEAAWNAHLASGKGGPATSYHVIPRAYAARLRKRSNGLITSGVKNNNQSAD